MKNLALILLFMFVTNYIQAQQNLIYNGDFELFDSCPIGYSDPWQNPYEITKCLGWIAPTYGTSDYFNQCANGTNAGITTNTLGYQYTYSGNGYLGALLTSFTGGSGWDGYNGIMWWEYVQGQFIQPLEQGRMYKIKFYISMAEASDLTINEFGAYISNNPISSLNSASLNVTPQVIFKDVNYFKDTVNWMPVEGIYLAQGGEKYITIGNFKSDTNTDTLRMYWQDPPYSFSYYFIDNAETTDVTEEHPIANVFTPNGDGINDFWELPILIGYDVEIYNRWGNLIIKTDASNFRWDGKNKNGNSLSDGVYYYIIQNKTNSIRGFIQLFNN